MQEVFLPVREETFPDKRKSLYLGRKTVVYDKKTVNWRLFSRIMQKVRPKPSLQLSRHTLAIARPIIISEDLRAYSKFGI